MTNKTLTTKEMITIGFMLFALFLGAGNMIFPPFLGQQAGENVWLGIAGFLITGVGLPLLGVIAIARSGGSVQTIASRVSPLFGIIFTVVMYLAIGPFFGIPRTATVAYEISVLPFLSENLNTNGSLFAFSVFFFVITAWLAMNPTKLVDRIGKILTPALLIILALLAGKSIIDPMGELKTPAESYQTAPIFKGFIEGYLTMDTIAALVFGIVIITAIKEKGIESNKEVTSLCIKAGFIAATGLALVYLSLSFIGATSLDAIGAKENGGAILSQASKHLYGAGGSLILALAIFFACITTSVGLVSASAQYFNRLLPALSYRALVLILSIFSLSIANVGLTQLIAISLPVLIAIYPLAIVLLLLSFIDSFFKGYAAVYICALLPTAAVSVLDGFATAGFDVSFAASYLDFIPLFSVGIGWFLPAIAGAAAGYILAEGLGFKKVHPRV
ncbi:LIVCS family branched-chain amino acid:cation transporter [Bacillus ectoiniformans]|uniref:branched-chain amino acid transport system II carrier protein n=1 Tax=Bacillus ectoiniformans TaxID=1494429 RepID=UPI00195698F1|nr:branched-chain amino acid transport system II carrier protein [Bacillus ectoiniformans]MBM7648808.1 LIVCS family branched-chain amino acid:cation transporter [Bacillus ectoiniformans]